MFNSLFKIVYFSELIIITIIRKLYTSNYKESNLTINKKSKIDIFFLVLNGIGMIIPIIYVLSSVLDFANYNLPLWLGWTGSIIFIFAIWLLWKSHSDLGKLWSPTLGLQKNHNLIISGIYKYLRHPMYSAHLIWAIAQIMLLHNWIAGYSFLISQIPFYIYRIKIEEKMMIEKFGDEYKNYKKTTGSIIPKM